MPQQSLAAAPIGESPRLATVPRGRPLARVVRLADTRDSAYDGAVAAPAAWYRPHWMLADGIVMPRFRPLCRRLLCAGVLSFVASTSASAGEDPPPPSQSVEPAIAQQVQRAISDLDSSQFGAREMAAARLKALVEDRQSQEYLARRFAEILLDERTSPEVCTRVGWFLKQLPPAPPTTDAMQLSPAAIRPLLAQINNDSCSVRDVAERRLHGMLARVDLACSLYVELKQALADPGLSAQSRRVLEPLADQARQAWLLAEPSSVALPSVTAEQMGRWIDCLARSEAPANEDRLAKAASQVEALAPSADLRRGVAERELLELVARDDTRSLVLKMLNERISAAADAAAATHLQQIADFAKPAMAAEVWTNRVNTTVQYLIIGMPQFNTMTLRPTHFDRIDDKTAHCVSGNSLNPGDYPVRRAIPHPEPGKDLMFHLTNLPTPRLRLAYEYQLKRDDAERLKEISRRTLDGILAQKQTLSETEILMLEQLDPAEVSRFTGPYFQAVADQRLVTSGNELAGQVTVHGAICQVLARMGTREAVPGLEQLARSARQRAQNQDELAKAGYESPFELAWIAALAIAQRDAWADIDTWLAGLIDEQVLLIKRLDPPPELGATAAAMLLDRHGISTRPFGLEPAGEGVADRFRFTGYHFAPEADRRDVLRWWEKQKTSTTPQHSTP